MAHTPNMPRTQVTICGAPKTSAIPTMPATAQPQEILLNQAATPRAMTATTAIGVKIARTLVGAAVAPVAKGLACASASSGTRVAKAHATSTQRGVLPHL